MESKQQQQKSQFDLPPVQMKKYGGGGFEFDADLLKEQHKNISKMNAMKEFDELEEKLNKKNQPEESGKSLKDLLKEKRETTEKAMEGKQ